MGTRDKWLKTCSTAGISRDTWRSSHFSAAPGCTSIFCGLKKRAFEPASTLSDYQTVPKHQSQTSLEALRARFPKRNIRQLIS
jgi:hypothetical protein